MNKNQTSVLGILGAILVAFAIALVGSSGGAKLSGVPLFLLFGIFSFLVQWIAFVPAYIFQTEKYFDLTGSLTYLVLAITAVFLSNRDPGSVLIATMVVIWAIRLGSFLFVRVSKVGHDSRFRSIKPDFLQFLMVWTIQGLWVFLTLAAGLAALTAGRHHDLSALVIAGSLLWLIGFCIEVIADRQKSNFRENPANQGKFIRHGLWAWSRHPNYFGEILLWTGIAVAALPVLEGWQFITLISPVFVTILLVKISGVRMLEGKAKRKWGHDDAFNDYQRNTPMLVPNPMLGRKSQNG